MRLSQDEFAAKFGFAAASVRNWEQGRRQPEGPARVLLAVIDRHPEVVEEVLQTSK
jgi:putative transcriptional regulator